MRRYLALFLAACFATVTISAAISGAHASARECLLRSPKGGHGCLRWGPPDSTTTTTSTSTTTTAATTTTLPPVEDCPLGSDWRGELADIALRYYAGMATRDRVAADAATVIEVCTGYPGDEVLIAAAQVVVDCFAIAPRYFLACAQPPENEVGMYAAALAPIAP